MSYVSAGNQAWSLLILVCALLESGQYVRPGWAVIIYCHYANGMEWASIAMVWSV